jgi:type IV pilus assembly protein PilB
MQIDEGLLGDFLIDSGLMTRSQLYAARQAGGPLYETLARQSIVPEDELRRAAAHAAGVQFVVLAREDISPTAILHIPEPLCREHNVLAYRLDNGVLEIAMLDLDDLAPVSALNLPFKLRPRLTSRASIKTGLLHYQKILKEKFSGLFTQGAHVVDALIHHALLSSAHGIHVDVGTTSLVRYRIGRFLREAFELPQTAGVELSSRLKVLAKLLPTSSTLQEGRFKFESEGQKHTVHVSAQPTAKGERLTLRLAREHNGQHGFSLTSLGLHGASLERAHALLNERAGIVVVAGPQRGGKTTTLYTLLDQLPHRELSIASVEDTIEHHFSYIAQTKTRPEVGLSTAPVLRAVLKQDPDVVMVGNLSDQDTLSLAISAANRGILVFLGVEADSAGDAIAKLLSFNTSRSQLASALQGVIAVSTVKKICSEESDDYRLSRAEGAPLEAYADFGRVLANLKAESIVEENTQWKELLFARAAPCSKCEGGYKGLVGLQEVLLVTPDIQDLIRKGAKAEEIQQTAHEGSMDTLVEDGLFKAAQGITSIEEVFRLIKPDGVTISAK